MMLRSHPHGKGQCLGILAVLFIRQGCLALLIVPPDERALPPTSLSRRLFLPLLIAGPMAVAPSFAAESEQSLDNEYGVHSAVTHTERTFVSAAFPKKEYTNSIVASRDTNISPLEVYDTLRTRLTRNNESGTGRALDVGAGAGVSTQVLYEELGYVNIDAVDWSGDAWRINVIEKGFCPPSVRFYELDDERFVEDWKKSGKDKYDVIAFNFAVNRDKALFFCHNLLKEDGLLLAPINSQEDYWLKQTYQLLDSDGKLQWATVDVGAWSVQFQPDVTQSTCQGIWCPPYNGFQKLRR